MSELAQSPLVQSALQTARLPRLKVCSVFLIFSWSGRIQIFVHQWQIYAFTQREWKSQSLQLQEGLCFQIEGGWDIYWPHISLNLKLVNQLVLNSTEGCWWPLSIVFKKLTLMIHGWQFLCDTNDSGWKFCREENKTKLRIWKECEHICESIVK